ncbi:MAG: extracellular solute-binding protein, partial [Lachnospiraceae bacterium]|nr:extracellular solute-binding protein [Lachnospiraceae bacterium]
MKKKLLSLFLVAVMGVTALAGCGNVTTTEEAGETSTDETTEEDTTTTDSLTGNGDAELNVFLYMQDHEKEAYKKVLESFVEEHADEIKEVTFEVTTQDEYNTKMTANMTANDMPDVFYVGPSAVRSYVDNGYIMSLDDYVDAETIESTWGTTQEIYRYDGTNVGSGSLYALPKDLSCFAFAYNKDLFDAAGIEYPDPENPYTYDEFLEVCQKLTQDTDGDGEIDQWGVANANEFGMTPYLYSNGVKFLNDDMTEVNVADNAQLAEALTFYTDLTTKYGV